MAEFSFETAAGVAAKQNKGTVVVFRDDLGEAFTFKGANGETQEVTVTVAGALSSTYRKAESAQRDRMLKRRTMSLTDEMLQKNQLDLIASCVLEWNLHVDGRAVPCTKENVMQVLTSAPWLRNDLEAAMGDASRFLG
jgi:hypothetical protein